MTIHTVTEIRLPHAAGAQRVMAFGQARAAALRGETAMLVSRLPRDAVYVKYVEGRFEVTSATLFPPEWLEQVSKFLNEHG